MDLNIKGKKALVCASSKGIGRAVALALADEGAQLFLCARSADELNDVARQAQERSGVKAHTACVSLSASDDINRLIDEISKVWGGLDILIHNTGGPKPSPVESTTIGDWRSGFEQLFPAIAQLNEAFLPAMKKNNWGRIVAVTSLSVLEPIENLAISNAIRSAVTAMLKTLSDEVARHNVTVNCVAPGLIHTGRTEDLMKARIEKSGQSRQDYLADYVKAVPMKRLGSPEEFAAVVTFLCSDQASYVTGNTICVDGGKRRSTY